MKTADLTAPSEGYAELRQLEIRNTRGGMIWQVYHVANNFESITLIKNARANGFYGASLIDALDQEETWPGWRDTPGWKKILEDKKNENE